MANVIKPKRSYTLSSTPTLAAGELGVNASGTPKVWIGNAAGNANVLIASLSLSDMAGSTTNITEGTNLYYTDARARAAVSAGTGITYSSSTGVIAADATSTNTASKLVIRDASGNFSAGTITANLTGTASNVTTNANLTGVITSVGNTTSIASQTGTGSKFVVDTSPTLVTPTLGVASATSINKVSITAPATSATIAIADGKTFTLSNTLTFTGTDSSSVAFGAGGTVIYSGGALGTPSSGTLTNCTFPTLNQNTTGSSASCTGNSATATKSTNIIGGNSTTLLGAIPYQSNTDTTSLLSPNTTTTKNFLSQTGTGTNGAAPSWSAVSKSDVGLSAVENTALSTWAGSSNITTTGTITAGTWNSSTKIGLAYGGTNANITATNGGIIYSTASALAVTAAGTSGQLLQSNGAAAPTWVASPGVPTGSLFPYAGSSASVPSGYLLCDGSAVSRTTYATLFTAISTTYGAGDGSTTFNVPDLRGRMPLGAGTGTGLNASGTGAPSGTAQTARTAGQWLGNETVTLTTSNIPQMTTGNMSQNSSHNHGSGATGFWVYNSAGAGTLAGGSTYNASAGGSSVTASSSVEHTHTVGTASPTSTTNIPPSIVVNYIIKT